MRDFKGMKRQRGRNRGGSSGGGQKPTHNVNRAFDSNGPDGVKIRGHAQHVFEKYQQLARDASASGDRVLGENYLQHAEHYFRLLRAVQPQRPASDIIGKDSFSSGYDIDFEDESGANAENAEGQENTYESGQQDGGDQNGGYRTEARDNGQQNNQGGQGGQQREWRRDRPDNQNQNRQFNRQEGNRQDGNRQDSPRQEGQRQDGPRRDDRRDRPDRSDRPDRPERAPPAAETNYAAPAAEDTAPKLRSQDGDLSPAPAFLQQSGAPRPDAEGDAPRAPRARRRRAPRAFDDGAAPAGTETEEA